MKGLDVASLLGFPKKIDDGDRKGLEFNRLSRDEQDGDQD